MQELQTPELQPLSMESKAALALLKYLPLTPQVIPQVPLPTHLLLPLLCPALACSIIPWSSCCIRGRSGAPVPQSFART